jgi:hypothetical protein
LTRLLGTLTGLIDRAMRLLAWFILYWIDRVYS